MVCHPVLSNLRRKQLFLLSTGHAVISFQLFEIPNQSPSNEQIITVLRNLIDKRILNLIDPNRSLLHVICGSLVIGEMKTTREVKSIRLFLGLKGEPINVKIFSLPNGDYLGEFTPKKIGKELSEPLHRLADTFLSGQYRIDVLFNNESIEGSPFFTDTYDPLQVHIGNLPRETIVGTENTFDIDTNQAGNAPLEVMITSPSANNGKKWLKFGVKVSLNALVPCKIDERSKIKRIRFTPNEIGLHHVDIKLGLDQVPGIEFQRFDRLNILVVCFHKVHPSNY